MEHICHALTQKTDAAKCAEMKTLLFEIESSQGTNNKVDNETRAETERIIFQVTADAMKQPCWKLFRALLTLDAWRKPQWDRARERPFRRWCGVVDMMMPRLWVSPPTSVTRRIAVSRFLGDNMSLVLSPCRARSSSFPPHVQGRRFHPYALACSKQPSVRWIQWALNASDAESRQTHPETHSELALLATCSLKPPRLSHRRLDHGSETPSDRQRLTCSTQRSGLQWRRHFFPVRPARSTSSSAAATRSGRAQAKRLRVFQRRHWLVEVEAADSGGGFASLEHKAVRPLTHSNYQKVMHTFVAYCKQVGSLLPCAEEIDAALLRYFQSCFFRRRLARTGHGLERTYGLERTEPGGASKGGSSFRRNVRASRFGRSEPHWPGGSQ